MPAAYVQYIATLHRSWQLARWHPTIGSVATTIAVLCDNGPRALTTETIAHLSGVSARTAAKAIDTLATTGYIELRPFRSAAHRDRRGGLYNIRKLCEDGRPEVARHTTSTPCATTPPTTPEAQTLKRRAVTA